MNYILLIVLSLLFSFSISCQNPASNKSNRESINVENQDVKLYASVSEIPLPEGYERIELSQSSFGWFLRNQEIKQENNIVYLYNGEPKTNQNAQYCILKTDVGNRDLQQCADAVMRLRAEYLFRQGKYKEIHFNFTSGDTAWYAKYADGYRAEINGNKVSWIKKSEKDSSYKTFRKYLDLVFTYAGTYSLSKELLPVTNINDIQIGDVFIQTGQPYGHAVIVVDLAVHRTTGEKIFLLAQSYMPAQEIHILVNPIDKNLSPWYSADFNNELQTPEWIFYKDDLKRFK